MIKQISFGHDLQCEGPCYILDHKIRVIIYLLFSLAQDKMIMATLSFGTPPAKIWMSMKGASKENDNGFCYSLSCRVWITKKMSPVNFFSISISFFGVVFFTKNYQISNKRSEICNLFILVKKV